jgi:ADP-ribosylglycohydrolase
MNLLQKRARGALLGLAIGDALGWPALLHRSQVFPPWTRRIRREIDVQRERAGVLRIPMPFSLNQPAQHFAPGPTDDTEWAAWTIRNLIDHGCTVEPAWVSEVWLQLAGEGTSVRGGVSTQSALENLRNGILPPSSGRDNPHYFDDGAACRAVPIGIAYAGNPGAAASAAMLDASVTNFEDGVWIAGAIAAALSAACAGEPSDSLIEVALEVLPEGSWSRRTAKKALALVDGRVSSLALVPLLDSIVNKEYSDGCVGPESLALSLALVRYFGKRFDEAVAVSALFAKSADAVPAIVGAITGALSPEALVLEQWSQWTMLGICIPKLTGMDYLEAVDNFVRICPSLHSREVSS